MVNDERVLHALRTLYALAAAANAAVGAKPPTDDDLRKLSDALADYEASDVYDFVTDMLFPSV
jgi:hypothetical protein